MLLSRLRPLMFIIGTGPSLEHSSYNVRHIYDSIEQRL
jgi:hypothetical protein